MKLLESLKKNSLMQSWFIYIWWSGDTWLMKVKMALLSIVYEGTGFKFCRGFVKVQ